MSGEGLSVYVLYNDTTTDYPGEWVVRRQVAMGGQIHRDAKLSARGTSRATCLDNLLAACPVVGTLVYIVRDPSDDPCIDGSFL